jgi:hypothetical protein
MKIKQLMEDIGDKLSPKIHSVHDGLTSPELNPIKEEILKCDEFKDVTELIIIDELIFVDDDNTPLKVGVMKLGDDFKGFKGKLYLHGIFFTPESFDPKIMNGPFKPIKNNAWLSPVVHDPFNLTPYRLLKIEFKAEKLVHNRKELHHLLDDILNNPEDYQMKGTRDVMIRGIFDCKS